MRIDDIWRRGGTAHGDMCRWPGLAVALLLPFFAALPSAADPLSAIDWLSVARPPVVTPEGSGTGAGAANPQGRGATTPDVRVQPLDAASVAGVGLVPSVASGLPATLWAQSDAAALVRAIEALPAVAAVPAAQDLGTRLLLAEATPPPGAANAFLLARIDGLIRRGAIVPAGELLALIPQESVTPDILRRAADIALLEGDTDAVCAAILAAPQDQALDLQVYCAARGGAWDRAATLLEAGHALGDIGPGRYERLLRFLDADLAETLPDLPPPPAQALAPLDYRLLVATGAPLPTTALPLPFAVAELSDDAGWKPRIEAAERLVRAGAISERQLFAGYLHRAPAASGGVWDRIAAFQALDAALEASDPGRVDAALRVAWPLFLDHDLAVALARAVAPRLAELSLTPGAAEIASTMLLLSPDYARHAARLPADTPELRFAASLARGNPENPPDLQAQAIAAAWSDEAAVSDPSEETAPPAGLGAALLAALAALEDGAEGDLPALTQSLRQLRTLGLEDVARRAALQLRLNVPLA